MNKITKRMADFKFNTKDTNEYSIDDLYAFAWDNAIKQLAEEFAIELDRLAKEYDIKFDANGNIISRNP